MTLLALPSVGSFRNGLSVSARRFRASLSGPDGRRLRVAVPAAVPSAWRRRRRDGIPLGGRDSPRERSDAPQAGVRPRRAPHRRADLRWGSRGDGRGGAVRLRRVPARVHRHQLRMSGEEGGPAERGVWMLARPRSRTAGDPGRRRGHAPASHVQDPQRLERGDARPRADRAAMSGCGGEGPHAAPEDAHTDVLGSRALGGDRRRRSRSALPSRSPTPAW
jgi:hypothetical protein